MNEVLNLIDQLIEEHKLISQKAKTVEERANDLYAISELQKTREGFMPKRTGDQKQDLKNLQESLETIENSIRAHFDREEKGLLTAVERYGGTTIASALHTLLLEHQELKDRISRAKEEAAELGSGELSIEVGEGKAWGIRVYIDHTLTLLKEHARSEQELFQSLKTRLQ